MVDRQGLKVLDVTNLAQPKPVPGALVPLEDARNIYVARTYAYVAAGKQGMAIVDVERPEQPRLDEIFNAGGALNDTNDVKLGMVSSSLFAYVADGANGLKVVQLFSPVDNPAFSGFSPRPTPRLIASYRTRGPALAISKGIDRDRAVDESGNQLAVFGRRGARPFNRQEMERMYLKDGKVFTVTDDPPVARPGHREPSLVWFRFKANRALTVIDERWSQGTRLADDRARRAISAAPSETLDSAGDDQCSATRQPGSGAPIESRYALLVNPFYPKDANASFGKHVLTPTLALSSFAATTPDRGGLSTGTRTCWTGVRPLAPCRKSLESPCT